MANHKSVQVKARMADGFKLESCIRDHVVYADQPPAAGGTDAGPTAIEYLFLSLGACIASIARIKANQERINLRGMDLEVEGTLDLGVVLGKSQGSRCGFEGITVKVNIDADMTPEQKEEFVHAIDLRCPVSDNLKDATALSVRLVE